MCRERGGGKRVGHGGYVGRKRKRGYDDIIKS